MPTLNFKGKSAVWNHHLSVPFHTLEKDDKLSLKGKNCDENLIIEGDNLLALKSLLPKYQGKIKCIYIDPPYNTGNEGWVYNDRVNAPQINEWYKTAVGKEGEDLTRHDKWLAMMTPRLKLLRELLSTNGVIFISIDDNEQHHLRTLMDEIFGEENFIFDLIRKTKTSNNHDVTGVNVQHEYTIVFAKDKSKSVVEGDKKSFSNYSNPDNDPKGDWMSDNPSANLDGRKTTNEYEIKNPYTGRKDLPPTGRHWSFSPDTYKRYVAEGKIVFKKEYGDNERGFILKRYKTDVQDDFFKVDSLYFANNEYINQVATKDIYSMFDSKVFDYTKPVSFVQKIISFATKDGDIVLDSFAGSGTTAHAVMAQNLEDGGNRKFILVEMEDYANTITAERVRRAIKRDGYDSGFGYYKLGPAIDAETMLAGNLPDYKQFAKYVYYLATGQDHPDEKKINESTYLVGKHDHETIYLVYKKDLEALKSLAITLDWAEKTNATDSGPKIVYAPACYLDEEALYKYQIKFVSIPYNLFERSEL